MTCKRMITQDKQPQKQRLTLEVSSGINLSSSFLNVCDSFDVIIELTTKEIKTIKMTHFVSTKNKKSQNKQRIDQSFRVLNQL